MKDADVPESDETVPAYNFLFLFDSATGSPRVHYFMVNPRNPSQIFPKMNSIAWNAAKGICSYRVVVLDNHLYILGGKDWDSGKHRPGASRYDPVRNSWEKKPPMKSPRCRFTAEVLDGFIYVIGGETKRGRITDSVERYDAVRNTWDDVTSLPRPRADHASCSVGGNIYVSGGISNLKQQSSNVFWMYEPLIDQWSDVVEEMTIPKNREKHNMVPVDNNKIFILGGRGFDSEMYMEKDEGSVWQFNISADGDARTSQTWDLSHPAMPHSRIYAGAAALERSIWVFGGSTCAGSGHVTRVEMYDSSRRRWKEMFSLPPGNFTNVELCKMCVPTSNTSFSFMDKYICNKWVLW